MNKAARLSVIAVVAAAALAVGVSIRLGQRDGAGSAVAAASVAAGLMAARLPDIEGRPQALEQWRGKVLVVNFWATWCAPCREEIPAFIRAQERWGTKGLQIVGIAIDEKDKVRPYAAELRINYPILIGGLDGIELARQAGNRLGGLPFTVVFDRQGQVVHSQLGGVNEQKLNAVLEPFF
jgi:thiol-disulfide isomerase/thioredoxin